ncbi:hypothetical protein CFB82_41005 [Burkholderia sp. HI2714]|uniref:hypothetical protein n=1 Tax=Burkholderia sp. HI2714 TaxID=2015359 RepID=UPI000B7AB00F|nr:hypothetical protein [Burkholderia sp. HI2714]OXJ22029.1 hypothetical protein CFB82_41005 [Burkholderia sp. HI2714]
MSALQIAQGTALNFGQVCNHIHLLVLDGYLRRLYVRPAVYQWTGRPLPVLPPASPGPERSGRA